MHPTDYKTVTEKDSIEKNGVLVDKIINYTLNSMVQSKNAYDVLIIDSGSKGVLNSNKLLELMLSHDEMRESWKSIYAGLHNSAKTIILEEGLSYHSLDIDLNKFQNNETKATFIEDAQRLFNLFNISSNEDYLKYTISPLISCIENALTAQLLLTSEKEKNMRFIFNTEEIAKASEVERIQAVSLAVKSGLISVNEGRKRLGEDAFFMNDEDFLLLSQGFIHAYKNKIVVPNSSSIINLNDTKKGENNGEDIQ